MNDKVVQFLTCGSVDDGKSTLIGRLLYDTNSIFEDQFETLKNDSKKYGTQNGQLDYALLTDGLLSERDQGITIDVAYRYFDTAKRKFIIADTPGHEQYTRNMATAASTSDIAIILIDATKGVTTQTIRHFYITTLFGIKNFIVAVNKMDLIDYSQKVFEYTQNQFSKLFDSLEIEKDKLINYIPISALNGDNIIEKSENTPWYNSSTLLELLNTLPILEKKTIQNLRFPIQYVNRPSSDFRGYCGTIASGTVSVADRVKITPSNKTTTIKEIITFDENIKTASKEDAITITLTDEIDINRGDIIIKEDDNKTLCDSFEATIVWMSEIALNQNNTYELKIATLSTNARVSINSIKDLSKLKDIKSDTLAINEIAKSKIKIDKKVLIDRFEEYKTTGSFILIDKYSNQTVATGVITKVNQIQKDIFIEHHTITKEIRMKNLHQKPFILWFTGLSSSGKSTLANEIEKKLYKQGYKTYLLDGDNLRHTLNSDLGFSQQDREENIRRVAHLAQIMLDAGLIVITAFISPFKKDRDFARSLVSTDEFIEVFIDTSIEVCENRDKKGLYKFICRY